MFRLLTSEQARRYSQWIVYLANAVLIVTLLRLRAERISGTNIPYFSPQFIALAGGAIGLIAVSVFAARSDGLYRFQERIGLVWRAAILVGMMAAGFALAGIITTTLPFLQTYISPFVIWLILITLGAGIVTLCGDGQLTPTGAHTPLRDAISFWQAGSKVFRLARSAFIIAIITALMLEIGLRVWFTSFGSENDRVMYVYSWEEIRAKDWLFRGLPYVNYGLSPSHPDINSLGYRGAEITIPKPEGVFRIVAMGGSTTYGDQIEDWREAYPAQLEAILRDEYGYSHVEVVNAGVPSYTSWEILVNFEFRVLDLQPDLVIFYEGVNDLSARVHPPEYYRGLSPAAGLWQTNPPSLSPSVLYRFLAINLGWMIAPNNLNFAFEPQYTDCCAFLPDEIAAERIAANPPIYYERNIRNLVALAKANRVKVLLSSWAYFPSPTEIPGFNSMTRPYRQAAVAEHNAIVEQIANEEGVYFYDLKQHFPHQRAFWSGDGVHMSPEGAHEQAAQYAAFLVEQHLVPTPDMAITARTGVRNGT